MLSLAQSKEEKEKAEKEKQDKLEKEKQEKVEKEKMKKRRNGVKEKKDEVEFKIV